MGDRGRTPAAELSVASDNTEVLAQRPEAPNNLAPQEKEIWKLTVQTLPADWFPPETHPQLAQYCRHIAAADELSQQIEHYKATAEEYVIRDHDKLLQMRERESRAASSFATRLRITLQATYEAKKKKDRPVKRPWQK